MRTLLRPAWAVAALLSFAFAPPGNVRAQDAANVDEAVAELKALYFGQNYSIGHQRGQHYHESLSDSRVRAWYLLNRAEGGDREGAESEAEAWISRSPNDVWARFALAGALNDFHKPDERVLPLAETALAMAPEEPDFLWLKANVLNEQGRKLDAIAFVDEYAQRVDQSADLLLEKAFSLYYLPEGDRRDRNAEVDSALDALRLAREKQSDYVAAYMWAGHFLNQNGRREEALPLLRYAMRKGGRHRLGQEYVALVQRHPGLSAEEKHDEIRETVEEILRLEGEGLEVVATMGNWFEWIGLADEERLLDEKVLALAPDSPQAEWVLTKRLRKYAGTHREDLGPGGDMVKRAEYRQRLWDFIGRPDWHNGRLYGEAYRNLFFQLRADSTLDEEQLLEVVRGMAENDKANLHITYAQGARTLAERTSYFREAEALAREGLELVREQMEESRERYESAESFDEALGWGTGLFQDALGWVYLNEGRMDEAEYQLLQAYEVSRNDPTIPFHLGRLYEERAATAETDAQRHSALDQAERYYAQGALIPLPDENPNDEPLFHLYVKRHGSDTGFDAYRANLEELDRHKRREKVLADRLTSLEDVPVFALKRLDGTPFEFGELGGRVTVINYWGTWCGPCVQEMPDVQELSQKYREDADVVILTINNDPDPNDVRTWMAERQYDFEVLIDDGYVSASGIHAFPTTWFIDREGRIAFQKVAWTKELVEEFSWRIEALR